MKVIVALCILAFSMSYAKSVVYFENLHFISEDFAKNLTGLDDKSKINLHKINKAIKSLYALNYFEDIWVKQKNINSKDTKYTFYFTPRKSVQSLTIDGHFTQSNKDKVMLGLPLKKSKTYTKKTVKKTKIHIDNHMKSKGYYDSQITFTINNTKHNSDIKITTNMGSKIILKKIFINGNKNISASQIENEMLLKKRDSLYFVPFFNNGEINEQILKFNSQKLQDFYLQNGYFDFKIKSHKVVVDFDKYEAALLIDVNEGKLYTIDNINVLLMDNASIEKNILNKIKDDLLSIKNDVVNISNIRQDLASIKNTIANYGYAFAKIIPDIRKEDSKLSITYKIYAGTITKVRDVLIQGNTKTKDHVIRREIFLAPNDIFSQKDYIQSISSLNRTGFFKNVSIDKKRINDNQIDLIITVEEVKGTELLFGGGHSSIDGLFVSGSIKELNTFGSGIKNTFSGSISKNKSKFNYSIQNSRLFNSLYGFGVNLYDSENNILDFNKSSIGVSANLGKKLSRFTTFSIGIGTDNSDVTQKDTGIKNAYIKNEISANIKFNNTNNYLHPSRGSIHNLSLAYSGFGGDLNFAKISAKSSFFKSLDLYDNKEIIFSYKAKASYLLEISDIPSHERLYTGGMTSIRGYKNSSLFPQTSTTKGGLQSFSNSIEVSFPFFADTFRWSIFTDYGMIGNSAIDQTIRASYGISVQMMMGAIPIIFSFPTPLLNETDDKLRDFEMTIGNIF